METSLAFLNFYLIVIQPRFFKTKFVITGKLNISDNVTKTICISALIWYISGTFTDKMPSKLDQELKKLKVGLSQKFIVQMFLQNAL